MSSVADIQEVIQLNSLIINHHNLYNLCCALEQHGRFETSKDLRARLYKHDDINESCFILPGIRILYDVDLQQWGQTCSERNGVAKSKQRNKSLSGPRNDKRRS